ncbi:sodium:solute symporter [Longimycelium tulufanense]|uniref:Sodium:solute symporter n=1 Tax=Longimycelium tulufanense TaxID=907463 RepID=A0A8J3FSV8_9PSEU|nr:sodium:solute symporter [Longimycelium tulufanense]GGM40012.1 sodium:solute symporter [Longimycelium tulufanense]
MRSLDAVIIVLYLLAMPALGLLLSGRQRSSTDYFLGNRSLPWWAVCFSVVATETSTLTVVSVPGVAYLGTFGFLQLALGYLVGRIVVALVLLPRYFSGNLVSAYAYLGQRFGGGLQGVASVTFLITRLLADGVRLFLTALTIKVVLASMGVTIDFRLIIIALSLFTVIYTYLGGIRAVVWVDAIQMMIYVGGALLAIGVLASKLPEGWLGSVADAGKFQLFDFAANPLTGQYAFVTAIVGGAVLSMASHGADQLIVQRLLACRNLRDGQRALIGSGVVVFLQFALFLLVGSMLWAFHRGASPASLGMSGPDELFPTFIVEQLPVGLAGLLIAGILAAAMSTLSSSLNSLSTSTVSDLYQRFTRREPEDATILRQGRLWTLVWAAVFVGFASLFSGTTTPVVELGLGITGYTYGALLGAFLLGLLVRRATQVDAVIAFVVTVAVMAFVILVPRFPANGKEVALAFPWYTPLGVAVTLLVGGLLATRHRRPAQRPEPPLASEAEAA